MFDIVNFCTGTANSLKLMGRHIRIGRTDRQNFEIACEIMNALRGKEKSAMALKEVEQSQLTKNALD